MIASFISPFLLRIFMLHLNKENFEKETSELVVVDFFADWCMPCRMMAPLFEKLDKEFEGKMKFGKVDTQAEQELAAMHNITGIPCLIVFKDSKEVDRIVGLMPEDALREKLKSFL